MAWICEQCSQPVGRDVFVRRDKTLCRDCYLHLLADERLAHADLLAEQRTEIAGLRAEVEWLTRERDALKSLCAEMRQGE